MVETSLRELFGKEHPMFSEALRELRKACLDERGWSDVPQSLRLIIIRLVREQQPRGITVNVSVLITGMDYYGGWKH